MDLEKLEVKVQEDPAGDRESIAEILKPFPHMEVEQWKDDKIQSAMQIYEMFSPPRVRERLEKLRIKGLGMRLLLI